MIGNAYAAQQKFDTAIEQYEKASAKNSNAIPPLIMIGMLYDRKNQPKKANEYYRKVLDINKNMTVAANNLAYNYVRDGGNLDVAFGIAQKAREVNPNDPGLADTLGWIYYKKGAYPTAIALLKESSEKFKGNNPEVLYHLGLAYVKSGEKTLAAETLTKALASDQAFFGRDEARKTLEELKTK
jgi:tetratricopeptide (TPR) repeat protein